MRLLETPYGTLDFDPTTTLVRFTRTDLPYQSIEDVEAETDLVGQALDSLQGTTWSLLSDLRAVAPRDDPAFEVVIARFRRRMFTGAARVALVVRTAVGALHVKRHLREDNVPGEVFEDEALALDYLLLWPDGAARPHTSRPPARHPSSLPPARRPSSLPPARRPSSRPPHRR